MSWSSQFMQFVVRELPNAIAVAGEGNETEALARVAEIWKENRKHDIKDRDAKVAEDRAAVDKRLAERRAKKKKTS